MTAPAFPRAARLVAGAALAFPLLVGGIVAVDLAYGLASDFGGYRFGGEGPAAGLANYRSAEAYVVSSAAALVSVFSLVLISSRFAPTWGGAAARLILLAAWIAIWRLARALLG